MKILAILMLMILAYLQYRLWIGEGSIANLIDLQDQIEVQKVEKSQVIKKNRLLAADVQALKNEDDAIEEKARSELGMIKKGETFYMIVETGDE